MKLKVLNDVCIGCGACQAICPDCFEINDEGIAEAIVKEVPEEFVEDATDALEGCPVGAIVEDKKQDNNEKK